MIRKKRVRNGQTICLSNITITATMVLILYLIPGINSCVVTPREILATVGEVVSLGCNAKPNNEQQGTVSHLKLENENKSKTVIFEAPVYGASGKITDLFIADGYFLSELDGNLGNATIQINETQLKHGGRYVCSCRPTPATSSTGSGYLVVLADKLSFVLNGGNPETPGEALLDLNCSFSFSGSISSVSVDLTINDANGTELAAKRNLSWRSQLGSHHVNYSFITQRNFKEQNFTCEMKVWKVWNQSSSELLRSMTSYLSLNAGHMTTSLPYSWSGVTPATVSKASTGLAVGVVVVGLLVVIVAVVLYVKRDKLSTCNGNSTNFVAQKCSTSTRRVRYEGGKPSIEHPTEYKRQKNNKMGVDNEVFVVENDLYDASQGRNEPTDGHKAEQIYNEIC